MKRISAAEALNHTFFLSVVSVSSSIPRVPSLIPVSPGLPPQRTPVIKFNARKTFQLAIRCVRALIRIKNYRYTPEVLSVDIIRVEPYKIKMLRKVSQLVSAKIVLSLTTNSLVLTGNRWLCLPNLPPLGKARRSAEPSRTL